MAGKKKNKKKRKFSFALPFLLGLIVAGTLGSALYFIFLRPGTAPEISGPRVATVHKKPPLIRHDKAVTTSDSLHLLAPEQHKEEIGHPRQPKVAIIIDDMGFKRRVPNQLLDLDLDLTFSFLPHGPHTEEQMKRAARLGRDIMLHLPMEARDSGWDPGPGCLLTAMNKKKIHTVFQDDLRTVPLAIGVNNHMGSRFTADPRAMAAVLDIIDQHHLFFVDSLTAADSVAWKLARQKGIKTAKRNVFLDNNQDKEKIISQIDALISLARKQGSAIGICHPYPATFSALDSSQNKLRHQVKVVGVHFLVK